MPEIGKVDDSTPKKYSLFEMKELLMEYAMRNYHNSGMTTNLKDEDLDRAISFDPEKLEVVDYGAPFYTGTDLYTALENLRYEVERNGFLNTVGGLLNSDKDLQRQMKEILDEELKQMGYSAEKAEEMAVQQQFLAIAGARIKAAMFAPEPHDASDSPRDKFDFMVFLTTLRGGYAGTTQKQYLYFKFPGKNDDLSSYATFLARLQEATQLCVIPPLDPGEPYRNSSGSANVAQTRYGDDEDTSTPVNALGIMLPTPPDLFTTFPDALQQRRDTKGYTIDDGAWIYTSRLHHRVLKGKMGEEKDKKLTDKMSYDDMVQMLRSQRVLVDGKPEKPPPGALMVHITHSMDHEAIKRWTEEKQAELEEDKRFRANLKAQGFTDEDIGEPYGTYLKRELAAEKENASRANWISHHKSTFEKSLQKEEEMLREKFFFSYSPKFAQAPFDAQMEKERERLKTLLDQRLKTIRKDTSGF